MGLERSLIKALHSGKVELGANRATRALEEGRAKLLIYSKDYTKPMLSGDEECKLYHLDLTSKELGRLCKKPFTVSALAIIDEGDSDIMNLVKGG